MVPRPRRSVVHPLCPLRDLPTSLDTPRTLQCALRHIAVPQYIQCAKFCERTAMIEYLAVSGTRQKGRCRRPRAARVTEFRANKCNWGTVQYAQTPQTNCRTQAPGPAPLNSRRPGTVSGGGRMGDTNACPSNSPKNFPPSLRCIYSGRVRFVYSVQGKPGHRPVAAFSLRGSGHLYIEGF